MSKDIWHAAAAVRTEYRRGWPSTGSAPRRHETCCRCRKLEAAGESNLRGHIQGQSETEQGSGSSAYVPPEAKDDLQLQYALELLRGQKTDPSFPANPEKAELKK